MRSSKAIPKEPPAEEDTPEKVTVAEAYCRDCRESIGPRLAEQVAEQLYFAHDTHEVDYDEWEEEV